MKNIIFYSERWMNGGIESIIMNIISNSKKFKYKIIVGQKETNSFDEKIKKYNVDFIELHKRIYKNPIIRTISSIIKFKKIMKKEKKSIVHINIYNSVGLILGLFIRNDNKVIIHAHNDGIDKENDKLYLKRFANLFFKKILSFSKYEYFACSDLAANFCFNTKKIKKYYIMRNGIDTNRFKFNLEKRKKVRTLLEISDNTLLIGHVGRFVYQKNHTFLINVFKEFIKDYDDAKLLLIGNGPLMNNIKDIVEKENMQKKVIFIENTNLIDEYMSAIDIFLFPSLYEGLGIALIEAQCSGLKCLASNALPKMVKITNNITFLSLNIEKWKTSLIKKMKYRRKDVSELIKKSGFDIYDTIKKLEEKYEVIFNEFE